MRRIPNTENILVATNMQLISVAIGKISVVIHLENLSCNLELKKKS
jgi:hypothetical protein